MGLPQIEVVFQNLASTAVERSQRGIVSLILKDSTNTTFDEITYKSLSEVKQEDWTTANYGYIRDVFKGKPSKVLVIRIDPASTDYTAALNRLKTREWNWNAVPGAQSGEIAALVTFIKEQREAGKPFKAVYPNSASNHEGIVNFTTDEIKTDEKTYTTAEYCARIAGVLAGLPFTRSATYFPLDEIISVKESDTPDQDINNGELIIIFDGRKHKLARGINSLVTYTATKKEDFSKIAVVEVIDQAREDIKRTFADHYVSMKNSYVNKLLFVSAVNSYLQSLVNAGALDGEAVNKVAIDVAAIRQHLTDKGVDVTEMSDQEIKTANTGSRLFVGGAIKPLDAMEDLQFIVSI
ncbi:phage tail sheath subtilisin-like domain-containing protein [Brevibacillus dissolubilis]|uniref:phage tail sheath subtilisin-like domain-containing protein n=1 Tax=Brevibacillus dissolubilis TaxID=1844116 RepID=UPI0011176532|nr:phage tail sheath subtilisin-like domain-containing protein [Brevibacillus dissolubilis]